MPSVSQPNTNFSSSKPKRNHCIPSLTLQNLVFDRYPWLGISRAEILTALVALTHAIMAKNHPVVYSKANILHTVTRERYISHAANVADLFLDRFHPSHSLSDKDAFLKRTESLRSSIENNVENSMAVEFLNKMIDIVQYTLRTNIYLEVGYRSKNIVTSLSVNLRMRCNVS